ncbi:hypothetical protein AXF42_Ash012565 [Apostasia shenzhenica]|uniref:Uncharacterized protein n=1 Tax=Apostasia shenzhenica TaxID=1088818 RepID=A0A2H9ZT23_9ASPA|nr:hypothetical protein AXF42_Ash012565 [Apostasia shenzhenica]
MFRCCVTLSRSTLGLRSPSADARHAGGHAVVSSSATVPRRRPIDHLHAATRARLNEWRPCITHTQAHQGRVAGKPTTRAHLPPLPNCYKILRTQRPSPAGK